MRDSVGFGYLAASRDFNEFSRLVNRITGLAMALNTPGTTASRFAPRALRGNPICALIRSDAEGFRRCHACDQRHQDQAAASGRPRLYNCHAGFLDMAVPVMVQGRHLATISSGQVLPEPHSGRGFLHLRKRLGWLRTPDRTLRRAYRKALFLPRRQVLQVMHLLEIFARQLCESAQRIRELESLLERGEIRGARSFVEERFRDAGLGLAEIARHAGLSAAHFSLVFHRTTGQTLTRFIQARRVAEARRLLADTKRSVTDICFACGFSSLTHFNRVFRRSERCSPRQHRLRSRPPAADRQDRDPPPARVSPRSSA